MTHSPFYYQPGFLIWHSKDLVNWTPVCRAGSGWDGSAWAPDLQKVGDTYKINAFLTAPMVGQKAIGVHCGRRNTLSLARILFQII